MKKILFLVLAVSITALSSFTPEPAKPVTSQTYARTNFDRVQMFRQASTSTEVLKVLDRTDELKIIRKHNNTWTIVMIGETAGYVLTTEINWNNSYRQYVQSKE